MPSNCNTLSDDDDRHCFNLSGLNPKFFKIILQDTLLHGRLVIPRKFVINHGDRLSPCLFLKVRDGMEWKMEVRNDSKDTWLHKGWNEFSEYYSLKHGYLLVFKFQIKSNFLVFIFDSTLMEIDYTPNPKLIQNPNQLMPETHGAAAKSCESEGVRSYTAREAADKFRSSNPWFKAVMKSHLKLVRSCDAMPPLSRDSFTFEHCLWQNVPVGFIRDRMEGLSQSVTLEAEGFERCWPAKLQVYLQHSYGRLAAGWDAFVVDNQLKTGDVCVFELVASKTLKVHIFRPQTRNA